MFCFYFLAGNYHSESVIQLPQRVMTRCGKYHSESSSVHVFVFVHQVCIWVCFCCVWFLFHQVCICYCCFLAGNYHSESIIQLPQRVMTRCGNYHSESSSVCFNCFSASVYCCLFLFLFYQACICFCVCFLISGGPNYHSESPITTASHQLPQRVIRGAKKSLPL